MCDSTSGLTYLRARDADPLTGRFLQQDTVQPGAPGTQGYNRYAYAANNPVTLTDPTGHNVADLIGDAALLGAFTYALRVLSEVPKQFAKLPPIARKLATALLGLGMMLIRQLLVLVIMKTIMDASVVFDFPIGRSMGLLSWVRMFKPVKWFMDACAKALGGASGCKLAAKLLPKLPKYFVKGAAEETVELGLDATLGALGLGGGTSFGKTDAAFFAGGVSLSCVGGDANKAEMSFCTGNSFDGAPLVLFANGTQKRIDDVEVGDVVWAANPESGERGGRRVSRVIVGEGLKRLVAITVATTFGSSTVTATDGHPFWVNSRGAWIEAGDLAFGDLLRTVDDGHVRVLSIKSFIEQQRVHNLTVDNLHTYFVAVGDQDVLVHNACWPQLNLDDTQFGHKTSLHARHFGLDPGQAADRAKLRKLVEDIHANPDQVRLGSWHEKGGGGTDYYFFLRGTDLLITKNDGTFVTVFPNGATNAKLLRATRIQ